MQNLVSACVLSAAVLMAMPAAAQDRASGGARTAVDGVEFVAGVMDFDLAGTGTAVPVAVRGSKALTNRLAVEFGTTFASLDQQFGPSRLLLPEAQISFSWRLGRVLPFVSGGGGTAIETADALSTRWRLSLTGGGGARVHLNDRLYVVGEMRLRGISRDFAASTAEWLGGVGWSLR